MQVIVSFPVVIISFSIRVEEGGGGGGAVDERYLDGEEGGDGEGEEEGDGGVVRVLREIREQSMGEERVVDGTDWGRVGGMVDKEREVVQNSERVCWRVRSDGKVETHDGERFML